MNTGCRWCALALELLLLAGCGERSRDVPAANRMPSAAEPDITGTVEMTAAMRPEGAMPAETPADDAGAGIARKIVYKANLDLVCEDIAVVAGRLESLAASCGGFVADAQLIGASGEPRWGVWKLRVPTGRFDGLLTEIKRLAEVRSLRTSSDDVSEEYYDVEARIRNQQQEEARLLRLLEDRTAKLDEVLAVEREIARVRGEVERAQARLRVLTNLTDLATISVRVQEVHGYHPDTTPGFGVRLTRSVRQSCESLVDAAQTVLIALAVMLPWLAALAIPLVALVVARRRRLRNGKPLAS